MVELNKVFLMGNLTRDPELRYSGGGAGGGGGQGGSAICKFGLATNRTWRDQQGQPREETTFVDITVFGRQAETCNEYLRKGRPVFIEGRLNYSTWEDRESGAKRSKLDVVADRVQFLGQGGGGGGGGQRDSAPDAEGAGFGGPSGGGGAGGGGGSYAPRAPRSAPSAPRSAPPAAAPGGGGQGGGPGGGQGGGGAAPGGARQGDGVDFTDDIPF